MIELKEICTCNHCLKTCEGMQAIDKSKWFHFRKKLNDNETDLTNSVDFCPDCAKLLASELRKYMSNVDYGHLDKTELEIQNIYIELYLNIYAAVLMYIIQGGQDLLDFIDAIPGKVTFSCVRKRGVVDYEIYFNEVMVYIQQNDVTTNLRTDWKNLGVVTTEVNEYMLREFLSNTGSPVNFSLSDNVYPKEPNAASIEYLIECKTKLEECGSRESCPESVMQMCAKIISLIRYAVYLIREK